MKHSYFLIMLLLFLLISCRSEEEELFPDSITFNMEDVEHFHLTDGRQLDISPALRVTNLEFYDSLLILSGPSVANDYQIHIHNAFTGENINSFLRLGRGPGEFLSAPSVRVLESRREVYFIQTSPNTAVVYSLDSLLSGSVFPTEVIPFLDRTYMLHLRLDSTLYLCNPNGFVNMPREPNYMLLAIYDYDKDSLFNRVSLPPLEGIDSVLNRMHIRSIFQTGQDFMCYNEPGGYIVVPYSRTDLLEVYDYNDAMRRVVRIHGPDRFFPYYEFGRMASSLAELTSPQDRRETWPVARDLRDEVIFPAGVSRFGYFRARSFDDGFYVVYCGLPIPEVGINHAEYLKRSLFFFRYDGTPVVRYTFDVPFRQKYAVDHQRGVIYILGLDGEIYTYDIP